MLEQHFSFESRHNNSIVSNSVETSSNDYESVESESENLYSNNLVSNHKPHYSVTHLLKNTNSAYDDVFEKFYKKF